MLQDISQSDTESPLFVRRVGLFQVHEVSGDERRMNQNRLSRAVLVAVDS